MDNEILKKKEQKRVFHAVKVDWIAIIIEGSLLQHTDIGSVNYFLY